MINVVGVRFQTNGKMYYYDTAGFSPSLGDFVIVDTTRGSDLAEVILGIQEIDENLPKAPLPKLIRMATTLDIQRATDNRSREREAYQICQQKIAEHKLEMKLVSVESTFDNSKLLFYFTANGRVDFRALVKDLASVFRTRIELRQIGVRDEARMLGGLGPCGRPICCGSFLTDFQPVSIKMAKEQNLSLNPTKISGVCGRLMCCLKYEQDQYEQVRKKMPRIGKEVITPDGKGTVSDLNIVKETLSVRIPNGDDNFEIREYSLDQISRPGQNGQHRSSAEENPVDQEDVSDFQDDDAVNDEGFFPDQPLSEQMNETSGSASNRPARKRNRAQEEALTEEIQTAEDQKAEEKKERPQRINGNRNRKPNNAGKQNSESRQNNAGRQGNNGKPGNGGKQNPGGKTPREQKFGQPVRRENMNREKEDRNSPANAAALTESRALSPREEKPKPVQRKRSGWADAVEKALESSAASQQPAGNNRSGDA